MKSMSTLAVLVVALGIGATACSRTDNKPAASNPPATTAGVAVDKAVTATGDAAVTAKVKTALLADPDVKGTDINVDTMSGGKVTLTGKVATQALAEKAISLAKGIDGVTSVNSNLAIANK